MAITTDPTYPVVDEDVVVTDSSVTGDLQVLEITSRPSLSEKPIGFVTIDTDEDIVDVFEVVSQNLATTTTTFDEAGEYGVRVYDLRTYSGVPSFAGDARGSRYAKLIGAYTGTVYVGALVQLPIVSRLGEGATLQLTITGDTVRDAEFVDATTEAARVAALQSTVVSALAALVGVAATSIGNSVITGANELLTAYEAHRVDVSGTPAIHSAADSTNACLYTSGDSLAGAILMLNDLRAKMLLHCQNSTNFGFGGSSWHSADDLNNVPLAAEAFDLASATVLLCDLRERCYERHRVQIASPAVHGSSDTTNTLAAPTVLDSLVLAYFDALAVENPIVVAGEPEGAIDAEHKYGMRRVR